MPNLISRFEKSAWILDAAEKAYNMQVRDGDIVQIVGLGKPNDADVREEESAEYTLRC